MKGERMVTFTIHTLIYGVNTCFLTSTMILDNTQNALFIINNMMIMNYTYLAQIYATS